MVSISQEGHKEQPNVFSERLKLVEKPQLPDLKNGLQK
jgi:hypothetical protein